MIFRRESMLNNLEKTLKDRCHVATGYDGDRFVGIKADTESAEIYFPIGWNLPDDDRTIREDIITLFRILYAFNKKDKLISARNFKNPQDVDFPIYAYLKIITRFLNDGKYYVESDHEYKVGAKGQISWSRTVRSQRGIVQNGSLIFTNTVARHLTPNFNKQITQIHKFCVYEAFDKLGWLYIANKPELPGRCPSVKESIQILTQKISRSNNDNEQELFGAMLNMLKYMDAQSFEKDYLFGTDYFERIWESLIDKAFGIKDKSKYFPKTRWLLDYSTDKEKSSLIPDSIMIYKDKIYVLDAKYYKYGQTGNADDLPGSADINKQITYGEYIAKHLQIPNERLFNAFLLPYNKASNKFGIETVFGNFGEAVGDWKKNTKNYERVQGIVVDTRFLMYNYLKLSEKYLNKLATCVEQGSYRNVTK